MIKILIKPIPRHTFCINHSSPFAKIGNTIFLSAFKCLLYSPVDLIIIKKYLTEFYFLQFFNYSSRQTHNMKANDQYKHNQ